MQRMQDELYKTKEQNDVLMSKYQKAQEEILSCQDAMAKQSSLSQQHQSELENMKRQSAIKPSYDEYQHFRVENYQKEMTIKDNDIASLKENIKEKNQTIATVTVVGDHFKEKSSICTKKLETKDETIAKLNEKIHDLQNELDNLYIKRKVEGTALLEVEHLKADNERLISMLKSSGQHKEFAEFLEDNSGGAIKIPPKAPPKSKYGKRSQTVVSDVQEGWVPQDAYKLAHDILHKNKGNFTSATIDNLLSDLNKIWRERERKQVTRIKQKYSTEVADLRRQGAMGNAGDIVEANKTIARLRCDLNAAYKEIQKNICKNSYDRANPLQTGKIDDAMKLANTMRKERKDLTEENKKLKKRIEELEKVVKVEGSDRARYMEGAAWMATAMTMETDTYVDEFEKLVNNYRIRKRELETSGKADPYTLGQMSTELIDKLENLSSDFKVKMHGKMGSVSYQSETLTGSMKKKTGLF